MDADWPSLNSRAWMRLRCCGAEHPTRVEGFTEKGCILAAPSLPHRLDVDPAEAADGFFIGWVQVHRALEVPVKLVEHANDPLPVWTVEATGEVQETQRRNYVRLVMDIDIEMELIPGGAPTRARTVDLSEGGLKCLVDEWAPDPRERLFNVTVSVDGKKFVIPAQVAWWGNLDGNLRGVGVRFEHNDQAVADSIRSYIFAKQLEQRRKQNA
jgi:hypothetical protein